MDEELLSIFSMEAVEHLTNVDNLLLSIEDGSADPIEAAVEVKREVHTLKGAARMLGLKQIASASHLLETMFEAVFSGKRELSKAMVTGVLKTVDSIRVAVDALPDDTVQILLDDLENFEGSGVVPPKKTEEEPAVSAEPQASRDKTDSAAAVSTAPAPVEEQPQPESPREKEVSRNTEKKPVKKKDSKDMVVLPYEKLRQLLNYSNTFTNYSGRFEYLANLFDDLMAVDRESVAFRDGVERVAVELSHESRFFSLAANQLQSSVASMLLVPLSTLFDVMPRLVRDAAQACGREIRFTMGGRGIEIDKQLIDEIRDMLIHLLRNAVDHGIEDPDVRKTAGKPAEGHIHLEARASQDRVIIEVSDDGRGLDPAAIGARAIERGLVTGAQLDKMEPARINEFIFEPGFSTAREVTDISGRGVGMDVVSSTMKKYNSSVSIESTPGHGAVFTLSLPINASVLSVTLFEAGGDVFAVPSMQIQAIVQPSESDKREVDGRSMFVYSGMVIQLIEAAELLGLPAAAESHDDQKVVIVVRVGKGYAGMTVDRIVMEKKMVLKQLTGMREKLVQVAGMVALSNRAVVVLNPQEYFSRHATVKRAGV